MGILVTDQGQGMNRREREMAFRYFYTSAPEVSEQSGYTYSRRFGAPLTGILVCMCMCWCARAYVRVRVHVRVYERMYLRLRVKVCINVCMCMNA